jgi:hypothetical protein
MRKFIYIFLLLACFNVCKSQELIVTETSVPPIEKKKKDIVRLGIYGGYSNMVGKIPDGIAPVLKDHLNRLKKGFHVGGDLYFFPGRHVGVGAKYSLHMTKDEVNGLVFYDESGNYIIGKIAERFYVHYLAPSVFLKAGKNTGKVFFIFDGSLGCFIYRNYGTMAIMDYIIKGSTFGISMAPGLEIKVSSNFAINLNLGLSIGMLNNATMTSEGQTTNIINAKENISRIDISIGLHWNK